MIIDAHTHIYPDAVAKRAISTILKNARGLVDAHTDGTYNNLLASMDNAGVDFSVVLPVATNPGQGRSILQWVKQMQDRSSRMIFFSSVHPYDPGYRELIKEAKEAGIQGLKFHPAYQGFPGDSREAYRVYEEALNNDLILYFHAGHDLSLPDSDFATIERFSNILKDFQGSKIVLAHAGGDGEWEKILELYGTRQCYYDLAFVLEKMLLDEHARQLFKQNEDYFFFGTDSPWREQKKYVDIIKNADFLSQELKEKLLYKNVLKLIKIPG
ncbi:MAG TPA: amidohydrolase family protein [Bacillota bacterium]|jgi:predicted TIM-barrel fold metal-dependent hydrolase|nr:amidohydrolase family protein [Peptococcaceae bacterium MAG4]NLW37545.1 amidohydrolase family protein [Peptococcaceae bacterium]HPU35368.1 amidohydrolase family protein [Bacillota bacterium]HPZ43784.1 amidohydrolase family protein [Bacillota bacterium]HQD76292.1 amidohydrolase family protein [Bacillota bacterium]